MAEQITYAIAENLLTELGSAVFHEIGLMYGVEGDLRKLENKLTTVNSALLDAEEQQERSHAVADWVRRLKEVVYDAENLLDGFETQYSSRKRRKTDNHWRRVAGQVSDFASSLYFRFTMSHGIKDIIERLDDIENDISKFNFMPRVITSDVRVRKWGRETCSVVEKSHKIVGRDENRKEIIKLLMQSSSQENLSFVVIVGIGGLGKTTLAQLVYNDQEVVNYFDLKMWVCVSDDFDEKILVRNIIKSATNKDVENLELDQLQKRLQEKLDGKRYLLVLDDVWNEDSKKWGQFITLLPVGASGSKILVTTRSKIVARVIGIDHPYVVEGLKDDESWDLFESLAFIKGEERMPPNLVAIGKDIVKRCKGVPLVIETLGKMLSFKTKPSQWLSIKNNRNLMLLGNGNGNGNENYILSVLKLSYDNLPIRLKQCFAYCALFPKNYIITKKLLVQLWMALDYIQPSHENDENELLEDVGDEYFEHLLTRSLIQEVEKDDVNHDVLSCKMHDLIHDLAQSIAKSEVVILTDDNKTIPERIYHVSLFKKPNEMPEGLKGKPIKTLFMDSYCDDPGFISSLKRLRVLKMGLSYEALSSLAELSHLRYLDLSHGSFKKLPDNITRLENLQTLKLFCCTNLKEWPRNMKDLINLRHLEIDSRNELTYMPRGLGELTNLQTLPLFWVDNDSGECRHDRIGGLGELNFLNNLGGPLNIYGLSNVTGRKATEANLKGKQYLERLRIYWKDIHWKGTKIYKQEIEEEVSVMESLQPHSNLKELLIHNYEGVRFPNWMMNDRLDLLLPNLVTIHITQSHSSQVLPPFSQLPSLKYLLLSNHNHLEYMKDYPSPAKPFFPSLKKLELCDLHMLKGWGRGDVAAEQAPSYPYLEDLHLRNTTTELCLHLISASPSLKYLKIIGIKHVISLPELQHASTLQTLTITDLPRLETLPNWIGCLTSLTQLRIRHCPELTSLPQERRFLPHLHTLRIYDCPRLSKKCKDQTGEYWPEISRIPQIWID